MSALLTTLPGDIPGLLRRGSPVVWDGYRGVVIAAGDDMCCCAAEDGGATWTEEDLPLSAVALDLSDEAARWQAARYCDSKIGDGVPTSPAVGVLAFFGASVSAEQIDLLARLVLRLVGRSA